MLVDNQQPTNTTPALLVLIGILILIIGGLIGYIVLGQQHMLPPALTPTVTPTNTPSPTATSSSSATPTTSATTLCQASQLDGLVTLSPGAGNVYGTITLTNTSTTSCEVPGNQFAKLLFDKTTVKNLVVIYQGFTSKSPFVLGPNDAIYATIHYPNGPQCQSGVNPINVSMTYTISPGNSINIKSSPNNIPFTIQACTSESELTQVEVSSFSTTKRP